MSSTDSHSAHSRGTSTEERALRFLPGSGQAPETAAAPPPADPPIPADPNEAFWAGVRHGVAAVHRRASRPHLPGDFEPDLTRPSAAPSLTSSSLGEAFEAAPPPPVGARAPRADGWTVAKERIFLETLARCGVVADACRAAGMSRDAAYSRRQAASGRAFALAWDAAQLLARAPLADDLMSRAVNGCVERVFKDGELVAERHRYDNRLTLAVLARLDRIADGETAENAAVRVAADEFEQLLDLLPRGNEAAEAFLAPRLGRAPVEPPHFRDSDYGSAEVPNLLARCAFKEKHGVGLPSDVDIDDLNGGIETWDDDQLRRGEASGYLDSLDDDDWPDLALGDEAEGTCASAECPRHAGAGAQADEPSGMCKLRKLYLAVDSRRQSGEGAAWEFGEEGDDDPDPDG
jgi:hypothetical protein